MNTFIRTETDAKAFFSYVSALLTDKEEKSLLQSLYELDVPRPFAIRMKIIYSPEDFGASTDELAGRCLAKRISDSAPAWSLFTANEAFANAVFLVVHFPKVNSRIGAIVCISARRPWEELKRTLRRCYPCIVPVFLWQDELLSIIAELKSSTGNELRVTSLSAKEKLGAGKKRARKSVREWTDESLHELRNTLEERRQTVTSLDVEFYPAVGRHVQVVPKATCKIKREGEVEVNGSFALAFDSVAAQIASVGAKKFDLYQGRGLREAHYRARPLSISYARPLFDDLAIVRSLAALLKKHKHSMHTVIHGNPYMHMRLTDTMDGSSFDVWAIPPSKIEIIPGLRATEAAIERLIQFIFEHFREGRVGEHSKDEG